MGIGCIQLRDKNRKTDLAVSLLLYHTVEAQKQPT